MSIEIIAEIANAHQGNYKEALRLGLAADKANAEATKFREERIAEVNAKRLKEIKANIAKQKRN